MEEPEGAGFSLEENLVGEGKFLVVTRKFTGVFFHWLGEGEEAGEVILFHVKEGNIFASA